MNAPIEPTPERKLARSVQRLTRSYETQQLQRVYGKRGRQLVTIRHDSLIGLLRTAGTPSLGSAGSSPSARMLADADAIEKLGELRADINALWTNLIPGAVQAGVLKQPLTHEASLAGWHRLFENYHRAGLVPPKHFDWAASIVHGWVHSIEMRFDPPTIIESIYPCPSCGARWSSSTAGDRVTAITYTIRHPLDMSSATCRACGTTWRGPREIRALVDAQ